MKAKSSPDACEGVTAALYKVAITEKGGVHTHATCRDLMVEKWPTEPGFEPGNKSAAERGSGVGEEAAAEGHYKSILGTKARVIPF